MPQQFFTNLCLRNNAKWLAGLGLCLLLAPAGVSAQSFNKDRLLQIAAEKEAEFNKLHAAALVRARELGLPVNTVLPDGRWMNLQYFDEKGKPVYHASENREAAITIGTNKVYPNGGLGLSLTGLGRRLGVWDGGRVRNTHQELAGRVTQRDNPGSTSQHATHVAGTMVASGVVTNARGMAYQGILDAWDSNSDNSEMATAAAGNLSVSNHSYGTLAGWQFYGGQTGWVWMGEDNDFEDYKFGRYDSRARTWDQISYNAPYYQIVKSAGNNRGETGCTNCTYNVYNAQGQLVQSNKPRYNNGGYDALSTYATAKNIISVAAIEGMANGYTTASAVRMSDFSSWGPTDDGRIKPDLAAKGVNTYSCNTTSNTAYTTLSGTSMAAPSVSGSVALLQQHFKALRNQEARASTIKSLLLHTVEEAGPAEGPDYQFGWGVMNLGRAAEVLTNVSGAHVVREDLLANGDSIVFTFTNKPGQPITATIAWTDPAGTPPPAVVDEPTLMLVHDLDMRLRDNVTGDLVLPYILDPASPASPATRGDNFRDNVEKIYLAAPVAGRSYTLVIRHKGSLASPGQWVSLALSGVDGNPIALQANINNFPTAICRGNSLQFGEASVGFPTAFNWSFEKGSPAVSSSRTPTVRFDTVGTQAVRLIVFNGTRYDTVTRFVTVLSDSAYGLPFLEDFSAANNWRGRWMGTTAGSLANWQDVPVNSGALLLSNRTDSIYLDKGFNLTTAFSASLSFKAASSAFNDSVQVYISKDCGLTYEYLTGMGGPSLFGSKLDWVNQNGQMLPNANQWRKHTYALPPTVLGNKIKIMLRGISADSLFIDSLEVKEISCPIAITGGERYCGGQLLTLTADSLENATYRWTGPNNFSSTSRIVSFPSAATSMSGTYTVQAITPICTSQIATKTVTVVARPNPVSTPLQVSLCEGAPLNLSASTFDPGSIVWTGPGGYTFTGNTARRGAATPAMAGTYEVVLVNNACTSVARVVTVTVNPKPAKPIVLVNSDTLNGASADADSVVWFATGTNLRIGSGLNVVAPVMGTYYAIAYKGSSRCMTYSDTLAVTGNLQMLDRAQVSLYPNPASSSLQLSGLNKAQLELFNASGQVFIRQQVVAGQRIDVSGLPKGIYLYRLVTDQQIFTGKLQKE